MWSRPVAEDWAEARSRSAEGVARAVSAGREEEPVPVGITTLRSQLARWFYAYLWEHPVVRKGGRCAGAPAPLSAKSATNSAGRSPTACTRSSRSPLVGPDGDAGQNPPYFAVSRPAGRTLGWLVRHRPATAAHTIDLIIGEAGRRLGIPRDITEHSISVALGLDGRLSEEALNQFLRRVLSPAGPDNA